jgi:hypothetical protein
MMCHAVDLSRLDLQDLLEGFGNEGNYDAHPSSSITELKQLAELDSDIRTLLPGFLVLHNLAHERLGVSLLESRPL